MWNRPIGYQANVQPMKPGCAEQTSSSRACSIILDFFILVLRNTPQLTVLTLL